MKDVLLFEWLEESCILMLIIGVFGIVYFVMYFSEYGFNIIINIVNLMFMIVGLLLYKMLMVYMCVISVVVRSTVGILV